MTFEWDEAKNRSNLRKHGFNFAEADELFRSVWSWNQTRERTMARSDGLDLVWFEGALRTWSLRSAISRPSGSSH